MEISSFTCLMFWRSFTGFRIVSIYHRLQAYFFAGDIEEGGFQITGF